MGNESSCTKTTMWTETLTKNILAVAALRETEFEYHDKSDQNSVSVLFSPSGFSCKELNALSGNQIYFTSWKMSIGTLRSEPQPVGLENKKFDSQEKSKNFALAGHFGPKYFRFEKRIPNFLLNHTLRMQHFWLGPECEKFSRLSWKELDLIIKTNHAKLLFFGNFSLLSLPCGKSNTRKDISVCFYTWFKTSVDILTE